jgi:prephenate dehydrogenase/3-phosphoshikimate 1-carboxyvinyltransferase
VTTEFCDLAAGSFRSGTRVARSDPAFWAAILQDNRAAVLESLGQFTDWTRRVETALQLNDSDALTALLAEAHNALKPFPR